MAAILQLRRSGTPSTTIAEPFFNTGSNTLQVGTGVDTITLVKIGSNTGNITLLGNLNVAGPSIFTEITGSSLYVTGDTKIDGNLRLGGNIFLGSGSDGDLINVNASFSGSLLPDTTDVYDIGSESYKYRNLYVLSASIENISLPGSNIVSSSQQISDYNVFLEINGDNVVSGSSQIDLTQTTNYISGVKSRLNIENVISGSSQVQIDNVDGFTDYSASIDSRLDNIELFTSSQEVLNNTFVTTGSNTFVGEQNFTEAITASVIDIQQGVLGNGINLYQDGLSQIRFWSGSNQSEVGTWVNMQVNPADGAIAISAFPQNNHFVDFEPFTTQSRFSAPVKLEGGIVDGVNINGDVSITANLEVTGSLLSDNSANFLGDVTASVFTGSFVGDGSGLENVTAGDVEFDNILNKPTLVSGSTQIDVNDTENFQTFSQSVDSRLDDTEWTGSNHESRITSIEGYSSSIDSRLDDLEFTGSNHESRLDTIEGSFSSSLDSRLNSLNSYTQSNNLRVDDLEATGSDHESRLGVIEGSLSSSINQQFEEIHSYTSSLKTAVDVNGQDLTIYGNLTVQGTTTTLNTTELVIEDKLLSLASGSTTSAEADGAGLQISGADASILWNDSVSSMVINQRLSSSVGFTGDGSELTGVIASEIDFGDITNKPSLVSGSDQLTQSLDDRYLMIDGDGVFSGSSQVQINNVSGFSDYSSSVDSKIRSLQLDSSSQDSRISSLESTSGSHEDRLDNLELFTSSQENKNDTLGTYSSSIDNKFSTLQTYTASIDTKFGDLQTYTASIDTKFGDLQTYTSSNDNDISNLELFTSSQETKNDTLGDYTSSVDDRLSQLETDSGSQDDRLTNLEGFSSSIDTTIKDKLDLEGVVSSSLDSTTLTLSIQDGIISGDVIGGVVSGSDQITSSLDLIYEQSGSVAQLVGVYQSSGSLGSAAWYNVSASISDGNPQVLGNAGAVKAYIDEALIAVGAGDITKVTAGLGMSGSTDSGEAVVAIDTASAHFTDGVNEAISPFSSSVSASIADLASAAGYINYVTNSIEQLTGIEVADFDNNVAVTFIGGTLKFIFGTPAVPSSISTSLSGFLVDRFNNVNDDYSVNASWNNGGYTLISASLYEGSTLLTEVGVGTSLSFNTTTSGSHTYRLEYTGSSPLDGTIYTTSTTTTGTISKSNPANPTLTPSPSIQLGVASNEIEQGATGSIPFTSSSADPSNGWNLVDVTTNVSTPYEVIGSATGSSSIVITATANYDSPIGDNIPDLSTSTSTTRTYTKIRSLRHGASDVTSFTQSELENISVWDISLGGSIGTIVKGTTNPSGQSVTISWSGDKYHYIVFDSARSNLSNITTSGFGVLGQFSVSTVGQYKVYKTNTLQAGGAGSSITYTLT